MDMRWLCIWTVIIAFVNYTYALPSTILLCNTTITNGRIVPDSCDIEDLWNISCMLECDPGFYPTGWLRNGSNYVICQVFNWSPVDETQMCISEVTAGPALTTTPLTTVRFVTTTTETMDTSSDDGESKSNTTVIGIALGGIAMSIIVIALVIARRRRQSYINRSPPPTHNMLYSVVLQNNSNILQNLSDSIRQYELRHSQSRDVIRTPSSLEPELSTAHVLPPPYEEIDRYSKKEDPPPYSEVTGIKEDGDNS